MLGRKRKNDVGDGVIERDEKVKKGFPGTPLAEMTGTGSFTAEQSVQILLLINIHVNLL